MLLLDQGQIADHGRDGGHPRSGGARWRALGVEADVVFVAEGPTPLRSTSEIALGPGLDTLLGFYPAECLSQLALVVQ